MRFMKGGDAYDCPVNCGLITKKSTKLKLTVGGQKMRNLKKLMSVLLMLAMLVSVVGLTASAADTDPNMTGYNYQFTYVVDRASIPFSGTSIDIYAVPADSSWSPSVFETATAAESVTWTENGGSTWGIDPGDVSAYAITGGYASCLTVDLSGFIRPDGGPASFRATNAQGGYVDITVIVTYAAYNDSANYFTGIIDCQIYDPSDNLYEGTANTIYASNHTDSRSYVTVMDALVKMQTMGLVDSYVESYGYVSSVTINGTTYAASGMDGWQYRVYEYNAFTDQYEIVPISELLGGGDMDITAVVDIVQWRYGSYYDADLFPDYIPA